MNNKDWMKIDDNTFLTEELVEECAAEAEVKDDQNGVSCEILTEQEINNIQAELKGIKCPSWHHGVETDISVALQRSIFRCM